MKKLLVFILLLFSILGCNKVVQPELPKYKEVTFSIKGIVGSMPTKATSTEITNALSSIVPPTNITLTLKSKTISSRVVKVTVGVSQAIPLDTYTVIGEYIPEDNYQAIYKGRLYTAPTYTVNTEVTIVENEENYSVTANYNCLALVFDIASSSSIQILKAGDGTYEEFKDRLAIVNNLGIGYIYTWTNWTPLIIKVYPIDEANFEAVTYKLNIEQSNYSQWCGKYYYYPVNPAQTSNGGITVVFPTWSNGI